MRRTYHSDFARVVKAIPSVPNNLLIRILPPEVLIITMSGRVGLGGMMVTMTKLLNYVEPRNIRPVFKFSNPLYESFRGEDWFPLIFENRSAFEGSQQRPKTRKLSISNEQSYMTIGVHEDMTIEDASRLFHTYLKFSDKVEEICTAVLDGIDSEEFDASVHFRATDKRLEAGSVAFTEMVAAFRLLLSERTEIDQVFLATDSAEFEDFFKGEFPEVAFTTYLSVEMPRTDLPRHFSQIPGDMKALEAAVNMNLLSKSKFCLRTASYLSAYSKILNPRLLTWTLNSLHKVDLFPEKEIAAQEQRSWIANNTRLEP